MRNRYYDPVAGRFVSRDPLGLWGDPTQSGNGEGYCGHDPVNWTDPWGLAGLTDQERIDVLRGVAEDLRAYKGWGSSYTEDAARRVEDWLDWSRIPGAGGNASGSLSVEDFSAKDSNTAGETSRRTGKVRLNEGADSVEEILNDEDRARALRMLREKWVSVLIHESVHVQQIADEGNGHDETKAEREADARFAEVVTFWRRHQNLSREDREEMAEELSNNYYDDLEDLLEEHGQRLNWCHWWGLLGDEFKRRFPGP